MSKTRENRLWQWLSKARQTFKYKLSIDRVENSLRKGMSDVNGTMDGVDFWIELKTAARPVDRATRVSTKWQEQQVPWLSARRRAGCRAFVLVQVGQGHDARRYLIPGEFASKVKAGMVEDWLASVSMIDGKANAEAVILAAAKADI